MLLLISDASQTTHSLKVPATFPWRKTTEKQWLGDDGKATTSSGLQMAHAALWSSVSSSFQVKEGKHYTYEGEEKGFFMAS